MILQVVAATIMLLTPKSGLMCTKMEDAATLLHYLEVRDYASFQVLFNQNDKCQPFKEDSVAEIDKIIKQEVVQSPLDVPYDLTFAEIHPQGDTNPADHVFALHIVKHTPQVTP